VGFHDGELLVQQRAGVLGEAKRVGQMLRPAITPAVRAFLVERRFIVLAASTAGGRVWVSVLAGPAGFLRVSEDGTRLDVSDAVSVDDPIAPALYAGNSVGVVAIDFAARRRNRVNGTVRSVGAGLVLDIREAFGNCPVHPHVRTASGWSDGAGRRTVGTRLDEQQRRWIERAETFFLGTVHPRPARTPRTAEALRASSA
jgi:predicted pyridoxine 5'-phosphate oxidase superfamily flavin-nucleotide-binding protein